MDGHSIPEFFEWDGTEHNFSLFLCFFKLSVTGLTVSLLIYLSLVPL